MTTTRILIVAGERSGDLYGAGLARALAARLDGVEFFGCGGEALREAGADTVVNAHEIALAGITEVVRGLPRVYRAYRRLLREVDLRKPQLAILIDFPDFNLRLAGKLKQRGIPIVYFVSPQVWAWRRGRIKTLKARVTKMLVIFDFEEAIYKQAGVQVEFVGHPLADRAELQFERAPFFEKLGLDPSLPTVALLPGSRPQEVRKHLPVMLDAAQRMASRRALQFVVAIAPGLSPGEVEPILRGANAGIENLRPAWYCTQNVLAHSDVGVVASGTATLEAALRERPMVVGYRVSGLTWLVGKLMVRVPFYSIVNILAGKRLVPELMQNDFNALNVAAQVEYLLDHSEAREEMVQGFRGLRARLGPGGAFDRAAAAVVGVLEPTRQP